MFFSILEYTIPWILAAHNGLPIWGNKIALNWKNLARLTDPMQSNPNGSRLCLLRQQRADHSVRGWKPTRRTGCSDAWRWCSRCLRNRSLRLRPTPLAPQTRPPDAYTTSQHHADARKATRHHADGPRLRRLCHSHLLALLHRWVELLLLKWTTRR